MSTRERWIVYPLLFLTLGIALRDKIVPPDLKPLSVDADEMRCRSFRAGSIRCDELIVVGKRDNRCVALGTTVGGAGQVELLGPSGERIFVAGAGTRDGAGLCEVADARGRTRAQLGSGEAGGQLSLIDPTQRIEVVFGHDGPGCSLVGRRFDEDTTVPLELPCLWEEVFAGKAE